MPSPFGIWTIIGNGFAGELRIDPPDANGNIAGTVYGDPIIGFWDETSLRITFMRVINRNDPSTFQVFTGYQCATNPGVVFNPPGDVTQLTFAGTFEGFSGTGATAQRGVYGWFAGGPYYGL
jgi:hypothetical protein